jgi:hypothetical protein
MLKSIVVFLHQTFNDQIWKLLRLLVKNQRCKLIDKFDAIDHLAMFFNQLPLAPALAEPHGAQHSQSARQCTLIL